MAFGRVVLALGSALALHVGVAIASPPTAHHLPIQGVARDAADALIPAGDVAVRIFADSVGGTALYDSGAEFNGAIAQGVFDIVAGRSTPLLLDPEQSYFLELQVAGIEVMGDAAGGRWRFFPGGGSHARTDLEARLDSLESAMGLPVPQRRAAARSGSLQATSALSSTHALLGLGRATGAGATYNTTANLLRQPVGPRISAGVQVELGPMYLFAPHPNPAVRFVRDVPGDQGRSVRVRWRKDLRERPYDPADTKPRITGYTLYRRVGPGQAVARGADPLGNSGSRGIASALNAGRDPEQTAAQATQLPPGDWDVLTTVPATLDSAYQTVVPTLCDSIPAGICWSVFLVRSISDQQGIYFNSPADSGYSVDNLAPGVPAGLAAQTVAGGTSLSWQPSPAPDFQYFRIYRGSDPGFVPGPGTFVHASATPGWTDPTQGAFTWKVTAVDFNGNESVPASTTIATGVENRLPVRLALGAPAPNPFRHSLELVLEVPASCGPLDLSIFDLAGRRIRTVMSGLLPPGRHTLSWDGRGQHGGRVAAGVYVARLAGAGQTFTRRMTMIP